ncbi:MAG: hypothetical protein PHN51_02590 [Candidatus Nanopelagicales bacterium]|nr:hypothetical protein [Candidatus Nanopelagicales bacterium]
MSAMHSSSAQLVQPGYFHRLGLAARPEDSLTTWCERVLGAVRIDSGMRQVRGIPFEGGSNEDGVSEESGAFTEMIWLGTLPICVFVATDDQGQLGSFVAKYGVGLHSVAWTVDDLWRSETLLRRSDIRITGVDLPGRHFFMHPADTAGLLIELTDTEFDNDPRDIPAALPPSASSSVVQGASFAWLSMEVADPSKSAAVLSGILETTRVDGLPRDLGQEVIDLRINDVVIRLAKRNEGESGRDTLHSFCIAVPNLADTCTRLQAAGIAVIAQSEVLAWTDPANTLGMKIQWVQASAMK